MLLFALLIIIAISLIGVAICKNKKSTDYKFYNTDDMFQLTEYGYSEVQPIEDK